MTDIQEMEATKDIPALMASLRVEKLSRVGGRSFNIAEAAEGALVRIGPAAVEPLIEALKDDNPCVRWRAARALGRIGDARSVEPLLAALERDEGDDKCQNLGGSLRSYATEALGVMGNVASASLVTALGHNDPAVRAGVARALGLMRHPQGVDPLVTALKDGNATVRQSAAFALRDIGDARAVEPLMSALTDPNPSVKMAAANALHDMPDQRSLESLFTALRDEDSLVRQQACRALGKIRDARAIEPLSRVLADKDSAAREKAVRALGSMGDGAFEPIAAALKDRDYEVRIAAVYALGELDDPRVLPALESTHIHDWHSEDPDAHISEESYRYTTPKPPRYPVREAAAEAIERIKARRGE